MCRMSSSHPLPPRLKSNPYLDPAHTRIGTAARLSKRDKLLRSSQSNEPETTKNRHSTEHKWEFTLLALSFQSKWQRHEQLYYMFWANNLIRWLSTASILNTGTKEIGLRIRLVFHVRWFSICSKAGVLQQLTARVYDRVLYHFEICSITYRLSFHCAICTTHTLHACNTVFHNEYLFTT